MRWLSLLLILFVTNSCALFTDSGITGGCVDKEAFSLQFEKGPNISIASSGNIASFLVSSSETCKKQTAYGVSCTPRNFPFVIEMKASGAISTYAYYGRVPTGRPEFFHPDQHECLRGD